ncbi:MAG: hypothetical protein WD717_00450 [Nitrosarchaeum sp.]
MANIYGMAELEEIIVQNPNYEMRDCSIMQPKVVIVFLYCKSRLAT